MNFLNTLTNDCSYIFPRLNIKIKKNLLIPKSGRTKESRRALIEKINMSYKSYFFFSTISFLCYPIEAGVTIEYDYCCPSAGIT